MQKAGLYPPDDDVESRQRSGKRRQESKTRRRTMSLQAVEELLVKGGCPGVVQAVARWLRQFVHVAGQWDLQVTGCCYETWRPPQA